MKKRLTKTANREPGGNLERVIRSCASILFLLLPLLICSSTLLAQTAFSVLRGTVTDPNGAALPGVKIAVTDLATNIMVRTVTTDDNGNFEIPDLKLGSYRLNAEKAGFRAYVADNVLLDAGQTRRLDIALPVGEATETVTVEAGAALITNETGTISGEIDKRKFTDQPAVDVYPSPLSMLTTVPGIQGNGWNIVISGVSDRNKQTWAMDGVANDTTGDQNDNPNFFATVQVTTVTPAADSARSVNFNMVSKRGENTFHGQVFYRHLNSALNTRGFFDPKKAPYIQHEWEGEASGPIWKDHTHFYFGWFHQSIPLGSSIQRSVPTLNMRQGDFSQFSTKIIDPSTGQQFRDPSRATPGNPQGLNIIPANRINALSQKVQDLYYPTPNLGGPNTLTNNFNWIFPHNSDLYKGDWPFVRVDHKLTSNNSLFFRWSQRKTPYIRPGGTPELTWTQARDHRQTVISDTHIFSSRLINTFTFGRQTDFLLIGEEEKGFQPLFGDEVVKTLGLQGVNRNNFHTQGFPQMTISGLQTLSSNNGGIDNVDRDDGINTYLDTITWSTGRHVLKVGGEYRQLWQFSGNLSSQVYGNFTFNGVYTGNAYADFLLGLPQNSTRLDPITKRSSTNKQFGLFVSDTFKISQKLTIDYGLRWDYYSLPTFSDGLMANFDPATGNVVVEPGMLSKLHPLYPVNSATNPIKVVEGKVVPAPDKRNFRPRISAAYRIGDNMVVRGGYGEYSETWAYFSRLPSSAPFQLSESYTGTTTLPLPAFPNPFPASLSSATVPSQSITGIPLETNNGVIRQFNLSVEREWRNIGMRASYIGNRGSGLNYNLNINKPRASTTAFAQSRRPFPQFNSVTMTRDDGQSRYDSLQLSAQRRLHSFTFNASWTWSNSMFNYANTEDPYNVTNQWARDGANRRHYISFYTIWEVPVGRGRRFLSNAPAVVNHVLGGWNLQTISYFATGGYFSPSFSTLDPSNTNTTGGLPDRIADGNKPGDQRTKTQWFDPAAFKIPGCPDSKPVCSASERQNVGRYGNSGVNILEGQGINAHHLSVAKAFPFTERWKMTLTGEISNLFNHPHFNNPNTNISNPNPGQFTSIIPNYNPEKQSYRQVAVKLRLEF
jgi:Carboxypeptidase regulatory-like domain/TonB dependent receptor-like, beta-barrel